MGGGVKDNTSIIGEGGKIIITFYPLMQLFGLAATQRGEIVELSF